MTPPQVWRQKLRLERLQELERRMAAYQAAERRLAEGHNDVKNNVLRKARRRRRRRAKP